MYLVLNYDLVMRTYITISDHDSPERPKARSPPSTVLGRHTSGLVCRSSYCARGKTELEKSNHLFSVLKWLPVFVGRIASSAGSVSCDNDDDHHVE